MYFQTQTVAMRSSLSCPNPTIKDPNMIESTAISMVAIKRVFGVSMKFEDTKLANTGHISKGKCVSSQVIPSYVRRRSYLSHNARLVINRRNNAQRISTQLHTFTELISTLSPKERRPANPMTAGDVVTCRQRQSWRTGWKKWILRFSRQLHLSRQRAVSNFSSVTAKHVEINRRTTNFC